MSKVFVCEVILFSVYEVNKTLYNHISFRFLVKMQEETRNMKTEPKSTFRRTIPRKGTPTSGFGGIKYTFSHTTGRKWMPRVLKNTTLLARKGQLAACPVEQRFVGGGHWWLVIGQNFVGISILYWLWRYKL